MKTSRSFTNSKKIIPGKMRPKPFGFCCPKDFDPLTKYNDREKTFTPAITKDSAVNGSPTVKIQIETVQGSKRRNLRKTRSDNFFRGNKWQLNQMAKSKLQNTLLWNVQDECSLARDQINLARQKVHHERVRKNMSAGKTKDKTKDAVKHLNSVQHPPWFQDFSLDQLDNLCKFRETMKCKHSMEKIKRILRIFRDLGITSTFVCFTPAEIKRMCDMSNSDPVAMLFEVYRGVTGKCYEEEYNEKTLYTCNERIILTAIAFLTFNDTLVELNKRLEPPPPVNIPPKPEPMPVEKVKRHDCPYLEKLQGGFNWACYRRKLEIWRLKRKKILIPRVVLPEVEVKCQTLTEKKKDDRETLKCPTAEPSMDNLLANDLMGEAEDYDEECREESTSSVTFDDRGDPFRFVCPKPFPAGRQYLSQRWQEFLVNMEHELDQSTMNADELITSCKEIYNEMDTSGYCDGCCACRNLAEFKEKKKLVKNPQVVVESVVQDEDGTRHVIGNVTMQSAGASPSSCGSLVEEEPPKIKNVLKKRLILDNATTVDGKVVYQVSGVHNEIEQVEKRRRRNFSEKKRVRNVPPCSCANSLPLGNNERLAGGGSFTVGAEKECGFARTSYEEKLPVKKNLIYLANPNDLSDKDKSKCHCKEELFKKKTFYQVGGIENVQKSKRRKKKLPVRVIDGVADITPPPSIRNSDEHIMDYDLYRSPYDNHVFEDKQQVLSRLERYLEEPNEENLNKLNWESALDDEGLVDHFVFDGRHKPKRLQAKRPICDCTTERKIVERNEALARYFARLKRLRNCKKQPTSEVSGIWRPVEPHKRFIVSGVQQNEEEEAKFVVAGVAENRQMVEPVDIVCGVGMHTPVATPTASQEKLLCGVGSSESKKGAAGFGGLHDRGEKVGDAGRLNETEASNREGWKKGKRRQSSSERHSDDERLASVDDIEEVLKEMAEEGFIFAKLPESHLIPQLQQWLIYRNKGVVTYSSLEKYKMIDSWKNVWTAINTSQGARIAVPSLVPPLKEKDLTWGKINKIRRLIHCNKVTFYSDVRQLRVQLARIFWRTMDYEKFPDEHFKRSYFIYLPAKESDGYVQRLWPN